LTSLTINALVSIPVDSLRRDGRRGVFRFVPAPQEARLWNIPR
jgi:hypothetical protein